jgi:hypothetical protein
MLPGIQNEHQGAVVNEHQQGVVHAQRDAVMLILSVMIRVCR